MAISARASAHHDSRAGAAAAPALSPVLMPLLRPQKVADKAQIEENRDLSTSLAFDASPTRKNEDRKPECLTSIPCSGFFGQVMGTALILDPHACGHASLGHGLEVADFLQPFSRVGNDVIE